MKYPEFFDKVDPIILKDPLADLLGAVEDGQMIYNYIDIVRFAGHSCPTVAGAYLSAKVGLDKLYEGEIPLRGEIFVDLKSDISEGVAGVIGNCLGFITGAAGVGGFKGIAGRYSRENRLRYNANIEGEIRFTRSDNQKSIEIIYDPSSVPADPMQFQLLEKIMMGVSTLEEKNEFRLLWQGRVEKILCDKKLWEKIIKFVH